MPRGLIAPWCFTLQKARTLRASSFDSPFVRDGDNKRIGRTYWLDMDDRTVVMVMTKGIGANLTNDEKRAHLMDIKREHLIEQVCPQEILPLEK